MFSEILPEPQSITQMGVHTDLLSTQEREQWVLQRLSHSSCGFLASEREHPVGAIQWHSARTYLENKRFWWHKFLQETQMFAGTH